MSGAMKKVTFVTAPMWIAAVMLLFANVKPVPVEEQGGPVLPAGAPRDPEQKAAWLEGEIARARAAAQASEEKAVAALEKARKRGPGPLEISVDNLPGQHALAALAAAAGLLSVAGPTSFERFFLAVLGSLTGGLLVAASLNFLAGSSTPFWLDVVGAVSVGKGSFLAYTIWVALFVVGMLRWMTGFEYTILASTDEEAIREHMGGNVVQVPLLSGDVLTGEVKADGAA